MTRDELVARAQLYYNEPSTSTAITTANWNTFADTIYQELCRDCRTYPLSNTQDLTITTRAYKIDASLAGLRKGGVLSSTAGQLIGPVTLDELHLKDSAWRTTTGTATHWYFDSDLEGEAGSQNWAIGLYPVPSATVTDGLIMLGWGVPPAFASGTATPQMPTSTHDYIVWGMCYLAAVKDLDRTGKNSPKLSFFREEYLARKQVLLQHMIDFGMEGWALGPPTYMSLTKGGAQ